MMDWKKLMSSSRYAPTGAIPEPGRSQFHKDYDRIVFSTSFRRLGRKTQVHPLAINDNVHTRLTHSIEVSSVGRSLSMLVYHKIRDRLPQEINEHHFGTVVQSACLAHDIGNPPFGHAGEFAIRDWFEKNKNEPFAKIMNEVEYADFLNFEGNAQGFRIVTKLEHKPNEGGMRLTYATLAALIKYPWTSMGKSKYSVFDSEKEIFDSIFSELEIPKISSYQYARHPLSFLMEAADDICYALLDLEDAVELGIVNYLDIQPALDLMHGSSTLEKYESRKSDFRGFLSAIRGKIMSNMIEEAANSFVKNYELIMNGQMEKDLVKSYDSDILKGIRVAKEIAAEKIFPNRRKMELEIGSYSTLSNILEAIVPVVYSYKFEGNINFRVKSIMDLLGNDIKKADQPIQRSIHLVTDFISGMTDNYATYISKQISGHAI